MAKTQIGLQDSVAQKAFGVSVRIIVTGRVSSSRLNEGKRDLHLFYTQGELNRIEMRTWPK